MSIPTDEWRKRIAWVSQKPYLFHDTIAANIRIADPSSSDQSVRAAARDANLDSFIESLPAKYDTVIGEGGARLSGGQAQRLALARAFLKNAPLLILDEPTSNLDPEQESLLVNSLTRLISGRTVITIAHRINTVINADQIVLLDSGRIIESGSHVTLLAKGGQYTRLVNAHDVGMDLPRATGGIQDITPTSPPASDRYSPASSPASNNSTRSPILRLLFFLNGSWLRVGASVLLGAFTIFASVGLMGTSAYLLSAAALHPSIAALQVAIVGVRFFGISRGVFRYLERLVSHDVTFRLLSRLRLWFYEALEPLAPARQMQYRAGDLLSRVVADVDALENFYVRVVAPPLVAIMVMVGTSLLLGSFYPALGWLLLFFLLALGFAVPFLSHLAALKPGRELVSRRADLHAQLVDGVQGLPDLVVYGRESDRKTKIIQTGTSYGRAQRSMSVITGFNSAVGILFANLGMWAVLYMAIPLVSEKIISGVMLASLALIALAAFEAVTPLPQAAQMLGVSTAAARRLFEVVDAEPETKDPISPLTAPETGAIHFNRVSFRYSAVDAEALHDISFFLEMGKSLAVVGPSGAGKTTLVNLLLRFWDAPNGILFDGHPITAYRSDDVRRLMAVVSQNAFFFNATIKQNLLLARPRAGDEEIETACRQAQIHEFIAGLPRGYETWIGEQGTRLSGGERQRLALARALLKQAPILVLDEPTANLDPLTERAVLGTLWGVMHQRTTLMITHRLVGLEHFNEILVLDKGRVVQQGTHESLLGQRGLYRRLWDIQNRFFLAEG